ncbi:type I-E CRISPR-associated protein Cse2/CasB [Xenorhabdus bovienii]|uniref:type I-E CRISPR-associated protein Cse2/CasB n=1 Tax=Xenorhabdus bovienii TaxID=40576 RepID=UPI00237CA635|nr:type I-E CRISPR-associated protein Cse2/CasB [Xenorhabdus bovienii]MDE1483245.1 type I-E CRISPR-associated protein Cse2/CasB [Xenorhabdus bovienii]MDE9442029.1 type I-E CRISPR-associated protein Cse2/CasB [Xenorhabdus bovienii]MDE9461213.1 type I-E CRISPR-associated protein Cse2/CasB [Xenorhabdus bovienii]MDE9469518.1 type I-E CRISPR-associated protein Cse2/CasB [Xenorhabdus bovienii]
MEFDFLALYHAWNVLDNSACAQLRRVSEPEKLKDIPAFYRLVQPFGWQKPDNQWPLVRMVFCLSAGKNVIRHVEPDEKNSKGISLGKALADSGRIKERRLFQLLRADWPNDMVQLRRLLIHAEPRLYWPALAKQLTWWNQRDRRQVLEDFILALPQKKTA